MEPAEIVAGLIDEVLNNGDFVPPKAGRKIAEQMRSQYPDEHLVFLDQQAEQIYTTLLRDMNRRRRGHYAMTQDARAFAEAAEEGDVSMFVAWRCKIDDEGTQRCIGEMRGPDHLYVRQPDGAIRCNVCQAVPPWVPQKPGEAPDKA
jgi:hypothetical protein